jgi:hypothetical protein
MCEQLVEKFLADSTRDVLEFPHSLTNYQVGVGCFPCVG